MDGIYIEGIKQPAAGMNIEISEGITGRLYARTKEIGDSWHSVYMDKCDRCFYKGNTEFDACHICNNEKDMFRPKLTNFQLLSHEETLACFLMELVTKGPAAAAKGSHFMWGGRSAAEWIDWLRQEAK